MGFVQHLIASLVSRAKQEAPNRFELQRRHEDEGAAGALTGLKRADCPYAVDSEAAIFWIFGNDNAHGEMRIKKNGYKLFSCSTAEFGGFANWDEFEKAMNAAPIISAAEAVERGAWSPRYVTVEKPSTAIGRSTS